MDKSKDGSCYQLKQLRDKYPSKRKGRSDRDGAREAVWRKIVKAARWRNLVNPAEMIKKGAPHLIHSDEELAEYTKALFDLTAKPDPTREEEEAIELLMLLIECYESERYPVADADPVDVLRFLLDQNGLSQCDIAAELGSESTVSLVLSGKRRLNRKHIERLSRRFHVSPAVFFGKA